VGAETFRQGTVHAGSRRIQEACRRVHRQSSAGGGGLPPGRDLLYAWVVAGGARGLRRLSRSLSQGKAG
jgi:hypothetical protein